jgi:hypothetical protein
LPSRFLLVLVACAAMIGFLAATAAAVPIHSREPAHDIAGLNDACGAATDSEGDVYVASAGEVKIYDPAGNLLASKADSHQPCGLAVDSRGRIYVSERERGWVVRYTPDAYPLSATPTYGAAEPFDESGDAQGISVDRTDDRLYVAEGDHIQAYQSDGTTGQDEVQRVSIPSSVTGGQFKLGFEAQQTSSIPFNASAASVETALQALSTIGLSNASVRLDAESNGTRRFFVTFEHALGSADVAQLTIDSSELVGGAGEISTPTSGFSFDGRIGVGEFSNATGVGAYTYGRDASTMTHYLFVADDSSPDTAKVFSTRSDIRTIKLRHTIEKANEQSLEFGLKGSAIGVDSSNGHFYLYDNGHQAVDEFEASGKFLDQTTSPSFEDPEPAGIAVYPSVNEVQRLTIEAAGGTFTLEFEGEATAPIPVGGALDKPKATEVQAALEALPVIGPGNITVHGSYNGGVHRGDYVIAFRDALGGRNVPQLVPGTGSLTGAPNTVSVATATQGSGPGRLYVGAGVTLGAKLLAFGPLPEPGREPLPNLSHKLDNIRAAAAVDSQGNVYVANSAFIKVFNSSGGEIQVGPEGKGIPVGNVTDLDVDSDGNVYALDIGGGFFGEEKVKLFDRSSFPPVTGTVYTESVLATHGDLGQNIMGIGLNPANDHLFVTGESRTVEMASALEGSGRLNENFAAGLSGARRDVAACSSSGDVYFGESGNLLIVDAGGTEALARMNGAGSPGDNRSFAGERIAVDQSNCHVFLVRPERGQAEEFDPSGAFVGGFYPLAETSAWGGVAVDNGKASPNAGDVYVAYKEPGGFDLAAFSPLIYGGPPDAVTGLATGVRGGHATLNGTVNPREVDVEKCAFEWGQAGHPFEDMAPCAETPAQIGHGRSPVPVHLEISGITPETTPYRFRLSAGNKFGPSENEGEESVFGPPVARTDPALPVLYTEATLHAHVEPTGLPTEYHFEYLTQVKYEANGKTFDGAESTPTQTLAATAGKAEVEAAVNGLLEGTAYVFRVVAANEANKDSGAEKTFATLQRTAVPPCSNGEYRTGLSANLPDCRAYELVTPAQTGGSPIGDPQGEPNFNYPMTPLRASGAGESLGFGSDSTLPGFDAVGLDQAYRAIRAFGSHPLGGWSTQLISTTFTEASGGLGGGGSPGLRFFFWKAVWSPGTEGSLPQGVYLHTPTGFEPLGQGDLGEDLEHATSDFVNADGSHVIFSSKEHLENDAAPKGIEAIYDRPAGSSSATVVSVKPDGSPFGSGEDAKYIAATEDGSAVAFQVGNRLYVRRDGLTVEVFEGAFSFAGMSADGGRVFFAVGSSGSPAPLWFCDVALGPCAGAGSHAPVKIAAGGIFGVVSSDGSSVLFSSEEALTPAGEENEAGQHATVGAHNLYLWKEGTTSFVAILDPGDFKGFGGELQVRLNRWTEALGREGLGVQAMRSTPDGSAFVFQSHARLGVYDNEDHGEIYRFDPGGLEGRRLLCVSCDPSGSPASDDAMLQSPSEIARPRGVILNITDDGDRLVFESLERLVPEDANAVRDVYEWRAAGVGGCTAAVGCLALISSGQGDRPNFLYSMTASGSDVFFETLERLVPSDLPATMSIYDAREGGGIPEPTSSTVCEGDACQPSTSTPPTLPAPATTGGGEGNIPPTRGPCPKSKRRVKGRCVARHHKKHVRHGRPAGANRGGRQ